MRCLIILVLALAPNVSFARPLAVIHAQAWTMSGDAAVSDATIVIDDGRILSVKAGGRPPDDATVIDAGGKPVTPGLVNAAAQLGLIEVSSASATRDAASQAKGMGASFDVSFALNGNSTLVSLARADGLTAALSMPAPSKDAPFSGLAALTRLRPGADILDRAGVALFCAIGGGQWKEDANSRAAQWQLLYAAFDKRDDAKSRKTADDAVIADVLAGKIPLAIVTDRESDIRQAVRFAAVKKIRVVIVGGAEAWRAADLLAQAKIPVVLNPMANLPASFDELGNRLDAAALLDKAGVTVAFGRVGGGIEESYNAGLVLREVAGIAVANGLPYPTALRAITVTPRAIWGGEAATLEKGGRADLVIWDGDPLETSSNAVAVIIEGEQVSTENRQRALAKRYIDGRRP